MFRIGKNFHIIHMTDDLVALDRWYDDVFSVVRFMDHQLSERLKRYGSLVLIGDLCIEPMSPAFDIEGWDRAPVGRFWNRFGRRWHSIAWYLEGGEGDLAHLFHELRDGGVRTHDILGNPWQADTPPGPLITHPKDTFTQLEFMPETMPTDPRLVESVALAQSARDHPLHLLKPSHVTVTVDDITQAKERYAGCLGGRLLHECEMPVQGTRSAFIAIGTDLIVELAQPLEAANPVGVDFGTVGPSLYSLSFRVRDLGEVEDYLTTKGFRFAGGDSQFIFSDPSSSMGVVFGFTTWDVPGDTRPLWGEETRSPGALH